jgi:hypothetical protein
MPDAKEQRRRLKADIKARAKTVLLTGLPKQARPLDLLALGDLIKAAIPRAGEAAEIAHLAFEASVKVAVPPQQLACKMGCAFCCHGIVTITAPEAFRLAGVLRDRGSEAIARFRDAAKFTAGKSPEQRLGAKLPCAFLQNNSCSVYAARPIACRQVTSLTLDPCLDEFEGREGEILLPEHYTTHAGNAQVSVAVAMHLAGKPIRFYELSSAVLAVLDTPNAEDCWARGEDIFAQAWEDKANTDNLEKAARVLTAGL